jgi:hypothetical protein
MSNTMTYDEYVDKVATELAKVVADIMDGGVTMSDLLHVLEGGQTIMAAWNVMSKPEIAAAGVTKAEFVAHVMTALSAKLVKTLLPLPQGPIPA